MKQPLPELRPGSIAGFMRSGVDASWNKAYRISVANLTGWNGNGGMPYPKPRAGKECPMIKHSQGKQAKTTLRCPHCGWENLPRRASGHLIAMGCTRCGAWVIKDRKAWEGLGWAEVPSAPRW